MVAEALGGYFTGSLALLADAGHMLTDVAALALSLIAIWFATRPATPEKTYGFMRMEILAALVNGLVLIGIAALAWYLQQQRDPASVDADRVYGQMAQEFLPQIMPGLLGLFIAALVAGVMSSCDSFMVSAAGLFTENLYRPWIPNRSQASYIWAGRAASVAIVACGVVVAYRLPNVVAGLQVWLQIAPMLGVSRPRIYRFKLGK